MQTISRQKGITIWGVLVVAALIVFFTILGVKLFPAYLEYFAVKTALENLAKQPGVGTMEKSDIKHAIQRRFDIEDVKGVDLNKHLFVEKKPGATVVRIAYEVRIPLFYNISALLDFEHSVQASAR
jgi:hypothetical protein